MSRRWPSAKQTTLHSRWKISEITNTIIIVPHQNAPPYPLVRPPPSFRPQGTLSKESIMPHSPYQTTVHAPSEALESFGGPLAAECVSQNDDESDKFTEQTSLTEQETLLEQIELEEQEIKKKVFIDLVHGAISSGRKHKLI